MTLIEELHLNFGYVGDLVCDSANRVLEAYF